VGPVTLREDPAAAPPAAPGAPGRNGRSDRSAGTGRFAGLSQAFVSSRNLAFLVTFLAVLWIWASLPARFLQFVPWSIEALFAGIVFVLLFPLAWFIGGIGAFAGWLIGKRQGRPREGASGGALGCWLSLWLAAAMVSVAVWLAPAAAVLLLLSPWIGARWLAPFVRQVRQALDRLPGRFNIWASHHLIVHRRRIDLRGRFLGAMAGLLVGLVMMLPPFQYPEALLLASRIALRNEPFHSAVGTVEWQQLLEGRSIPARRRLSHLAIVEMDDDAVARLLTGSSEAALNAELIARLRRWGAQRIVVPVAETLPEAWTTSGHGVPAPVFLPRLLKPLVYRRRPPLPSAALARFRTDIPRLLAALRAAPDTILCPLSVVTWYPESGKAEEILSPLRRGAPLVGSARFGLYHVQQLPTLSARDESGHPAVPLLLAGRAGQTGAASASHSMDGSHWPPRLPTVRPDEILLNFAGSGPRVVVPHVAYSTLLAGRRIYDPLRGEWLPPARFFHNRTVFLDTLYQPTYSTPVGRLSAMELLAAAVDNLAQRRPLAPAPLGLQIALTLGFGAMVGRLALGRSPLQGFFRWTAALAVYLIVAFGLFIFPGLWLPIFPIICAGLLAFLVVNQLVFAADEEELQRQRLLQTQREREMAVSREIQMTLMPEPTTRVGSFVLANRSEPAREVGGDFCCVFPLGRAGEQVGVALGDVSGKGIQGAMYMTVATTLLEARAGSDTPPGRVLADANQRLRPKLRRRRMFVTAVYGVLDAGNATWTYASAGQVPPLHLMADGRVVPLRAVGPPLGSLPEPSYRDERVTLGPGDGLLLASDGFVEARDAAGRPLGYDGFRELVSRQLPRPPEALLEALFDGIHNHLGEQAQDDLTLLLIYREA
jgi:serine phosphatase RsbU (regulator of sigma subunit)/CHASE2 domain-containing sensor protein